MSSSKWKITAVTLAFAICLLLIYMFVQARLREHLSPATVATQVDKLSQLVTVRYRMQRVVGLKEEKEPVGEESILLMVEGQVLAGVDLHRVTAGDVRFSGARSATITLPPAVIFNTFLDEKQTKVWDRHITWWTPWVPYDPDLEHKARLQGIQDMRKAALNMGILDQAKNNAQSALRDFFQAAGLKVSFKVRGID